MGKLPSTATPQKTAWYEQAARTCSTWFAAFAVIIAGAAAAVAAFTDVVPDKARGYVVAFTGAAGVLSAALTKGAGVLTANNVYSTKTHHSALNDQAAIIEKRHANKVGASTLAGPSIDLPIAPTIPIPGDPGPSGKEAERQGMTAGVAAVPAAGPEAIDWQPRRATDPNDPAHR